MGSDTSGLWGNVIFDNNFSISVITESEKETKRIFYLLSDGGQVIMPLSKTFWGDYFGMVRDKFSITWMVSNKSN